MKIEGTNVVATGHYHLDEPQKEGIATVLRFLKAVYPEALLDDDQKHTLEVRLTGKYHDKDSSHAPQCTIVAIFKTPFLVVRPICFIAQNGSVAWKIPNGNCSTIQLANVAEYLDEAMGVGSMIPR